MLGLAIGDSLGNTSESLNPDRRKALFGEITDYLANRHGGDDRGYPSDDSQLAFWTLEQLIADRGLVPESLARRFTRGRIFGMGQTVAEFLRRMNDGAPWQQCGPESPGNGALMRIAPVLFPHLRTGGRQLWADTTMAAMMTHNDLASTASCLTFVTMLWELLDMRSPPRRDWWLNRFVELMPDLEGEGRYAPRGGRFMDYAGPLWRYTQERIRWAEAEEVPTVDACNAWHSGAYLLETVPSVLLILTRYADNPEGAIIRAVNDTRDNDSVAAIVGAAVGALHGSSALPYRWRQGLSGRTAEADDGRMFELLAEARTVFWAERPADEPHSPRET